MTSPDRCQAVVYVRDCLRRCGGRQHFRMHYNKQQCGRNAQADGLCWQHLGGSNVIRCGYVHREPESKKETA